MKKITCMVVGAGGRGQLYARHGTRIDKDFKVVAVAEPREERRNKMVELYDIPPENRFNTWQEAVEKGKIADCVINGLMDGHHKDSACALLAQGYDMLLEKPLATSLEDSLAIIEAARKHKRHVLLGFVLRYTPFYSRVKEIVDSGRLGRIMQIRMSENVGWVHYSSSFVRHQYRASPLCSSFLVQKSCHDTDIMAWLLAGNKPVRVCSFGSLKFFNEDNVPEGATKYCFDGCPHLDTCIYSAEMRLVKDKHFREGIENGAEMTDEEVRAKYRHTWDDNCVFQNDNNVTDRQSLIVEFEDGALGVFDMHGFDMYGGRQIHVYGQMGSLEGSTRTEKIIIRTPAMVGREVNEEVIDLAEEIKKAGSGHGGGDSRLTEDFLAVVRGGGHSIADIFDAESGHRIAFAGDKSMENGGIPVNVWD